MSAFAEVASTYEAFGKNEPFYAVLTKDQYKSEQLDKDAFYETGRAQIADTLAAIKHHGIDLTFGKALDFGCGVGRLTNALAEHFKEATGIDVSSTMIDTAIEHRRHENCWFMVNKEQDLRLLDDAEFDFIYSDITIQHIPKPASENYIQEFTRLLKPGGLAVFLVPDGPNHIEGSVSARLDRFYREKFRPWGKRIRGKHAVHVHPIARQRVEALIAESGGKLVHTEAHPDFKAKPGRYQPLYYWVQKIDK